MSTHSDHKHEQGQEKAKAYIRSECAKSGINDAGIEKALRLVCALHDLSCELGFAMLMGVVGIGPKGGRPEFLDRVHIELEFEDGEAVREESAQEAMRRERSN